MTQHYKFGGSTATRSLNCHAWTRLAERMPPVIAGPAAAEGTAMHYMLLDKALVDPDYEPEDDLGKLVENVTIKEAHVEKVYAALEVQEDMNDELNLTIETEKTFEYNEHIGGTADVIGINRADNIFAVGDLKTGDGEMVYASYNGVPNEQLMFYAWLAVLDYSYRNEFDFDDFTAIILYIIQPSERRDDPYDECQVKLKDIVEFGKRHTKAVAAHGKPSDPNPGKWCKYCPAEPTCPAKTGQIAAAMRLKKGSVELADLVKGLGMVDEVEAWCRSVRKIAHEQAEVGVQIPGYKLVAKRAMRIWDDEHAILGKCKASRKLAAHEYYEQKLKSPAKLEAVCKKKKVDFTKFDEYISMHSSGTTLVHDSDKRTAAIPLNSLKALAGSIK